MWALRRNNTTKYLFPAISYTKDKHLYSVKHLKWSLSLEWVQRLFMPSVYLSKLSFLQQQPLLPTILYMVEELSPQWQLPFAFLVSRGKNFQVKWWFGKETAWVSCSASVCLQQAVLEDMLEQSNAHKLFWNDLNALSGTEEGELYCLQNSRRANCVCLWLGWDMKWSRGSKHVAANISSWLWRHSLINREPKVLCNFLWIVLLMQEGF